jgi:cell division protein FtsN
MNLRKLSSLFSIALLFLALACGKDREEAPSNREGYTDSSIPAPGAPPKNDVKPAPDEQPALDDGGKYVVEVGSFENMEAAMKLSQELRLARINNDIQRIGGKKFRVVVGKGYSRSRAEKMLEKIIEAGFGNAKVVSSQAS